MINWLFNTSEFITRDHCGTGWTQSLIYADQLANMFIVFAYYYIPYKMYRLYQERKNDIPKVDIFKLFIYFPIFCGLSRICNVTVFFCAPYRFYVFCDWLCAISAMTLAFKLHPAIDYLINLPSVEQEIKARKLVEDENKLRVAAQNTLEMTNKNLQLVIRRLEHMVRIEMWIHDKKGTIDELTSMLEVLHNGDSDQ